MHIAFGGALPFYDSPCSLYSSSHGPFPPTLSTFVTPVFLQCQCHQAFLLALQRWGQWREGSVTLGPGTFSLMLSEVKHNSWHGYFLTKKHTIRASQEIRGCPVSPVPSPLALSPLSDQVILQSYRHRHRKTKECLWACRVA